MTQHTVTLTLYTAVSRYKTACPWLKPSEVADALLRGGQCPVTTEPVTATQRGCFYTFATKDGLTANILLGKAGK